MVSLLSIQFCIVIVSLYTISASSVLMLQLFNAHCAPSGITVIRDLTLRQFTEEIAVAANVLIEIAGVNSGTDLLLVTLFEYYLLI